MVRKRYKGELNHVRQRVVPVENFLTFSEVWCHYILKLTFRSIPGFRCFFPPRHFKTFFLSIRNVQFPTNFCSNRLIDFLLNTSLIIYCVLCLVTEVTYI